MNHENYIITQLMIKQLKEWKKTYNNLDANKCFWHDINCSREARKLCRIIFPEGWSGPICVIDAKGIFDVYSRVQCILEYSSKYNLTTFSIKDVLGPYGVMTEYNRGIDMEFITYDGQLHIVHIPFIKLQKLVSDEFQKNA